MNIEDPATLLRYLVLRHGVKESNVVGQRVLRGGVSNRTVLVQRASGKDWVVKQALARLRVKEEWLSDPSRIHREAEGLRVLHPLAPPGVIVPLVFEDEDEHILAMEAVQEPHANWKDHLLRGEVDMDIVRQFGRCLARIHTRFDEPAYPQNGLLRDRQFFESLRIDPYYVRSAEQAPEARPFLMSLIADTRTRCVTLVHGDYSPKNILIYEGHLVLLDHEVIHVGDPAFDIGFSLTHLMSKANHLPAVRDVFVHAAGLYWDTYRRDIEDAPWAESLERVAVRHTIACLLARVDGRSPLEYLSASARSRQRAASLRLAADTPETVPELVDAFTRQLNP